MATFLLIHGASHGAWCWERVLPLLQADGHQATAIDLPGHGQDETPRGTVRLADYVARILDRLEPDTVLIGHSFGGFPITLAAAEAPQNVRALVYLAALPPRSGHAFTAFRAQAITPELSATQTVDREAGVTRVIAEKAGTVFYSDCTVEDRDWALSRLTPQPIAVMTEPVHFDRPVVESHYICCTKDRVVFPAFQADAAQSMDFRHDMHTGHSPFLSDPKGLARILNQIADS